MENESRIKKWLERHSFFGMIFISEEEYVKMANAESEVLQIRASASQEKYDLQNRLRALALERDELKKIVGEYRSANRLSEFINVFDGDTEPVDSQKRRVYVSQVAGAHKDILEPKLKSMLSKTFMLLEPSDNDRDFDQAVKGAIYFGRELLRWGERMVNEHVSYQTQSNEDNNKE